MIAVAGELVLYFESEAVMTRTLIIFLALGASMAQAPADDSRPASSNVLNAQYPRVYRTIA